MFTGDRFYIPSTFSSGCWKCLPWFEFSHGTPSAPARWLFSHTLESTRQFLEERYLLSDASYSIRYGCACSLHINLKGHALLHAEPNLCLRHLKAEKALPSPGKCFSPPTRDAWAREGHSEADWLELGFLGQWVTLVTSSWSLPLSSEGPGHCWCFQLLQVSAFISLWCLHISTMSFVYRPRCCKNLQERITREELERGKLCSSHFYH